LTGIGVDAPPQIRKITSRTSRTPSPRASMIPVDAESRVLLSLIYPIVGLLLVRIAIGRAVMPLSFRSWPASPGRPFAALGFYERSRRREQHLACSVGQVSAASCNRHRWATSRCWALPDRRIPVLVIVAQAIYLLNFGYAAPEWTPFCAISSPRRPAGR